jgi:hypothetical protein
MLARIGGKNHGNEQTQQNQPSHGRSSLLNPPHSAPTGGKPGGKSRQAVRGRIVSRTEQTAGKPMRELYTGRSTRDKQIIWTRHGNHENGRCGGTGLRVPELACLRGPGA